MSDDDFDRDDSDLGPDWVNTYSVLGVPIPILRGVKVVPVLDQRLARAEVECVKAATDTASGEYDVVLYVHDGVVDTRPSYILAMRAQALDEVQELIQPGDEPWTDPPLPTQEQWDRIVAAAFPPPPMA